MGSSTEMIGSVWECFPTGCTNKGSVNTGTAQTGCIFVQSPVTPFTVDNYLNTYLADVTLGTISGNSIQGFRIYYKLQVSPAPPTPSFADVPPSHVFYQYIEALKASGITGGCTATQYCPDAPITRGQMAVFLARALGLHFAN